jgi:hypothetical protein
MKRIFFSLWFYSIASLALAGGSLRQSDLDPILGKLASEWTKLNAAYDITEIGWGVRIGSRVNEHLGGMRILPFSFRARPKGSRGDFTVVITITGDNVFTNSNGKIVDLDDAVACKLRPKAIEVRNMAK